MPRPCVPHHPCCRTHLPSHFPSGLPAAMGGCVDQQIETETPTLRELKAAILANAAAVVLTHNHPSGDPTPSHDDCELTRSRGDAGDLSSIAVLDHIVIGDRRYFSFRDGGLL